MDLFVSVIIPTYLRPQRTERAILSVLSGDYPPEGYEVLVVDSSLNDDLAPVMERLDQDPRYAGRVRLLRKEPEGPGASCNFGARHARGEILAFIDSDCDAERDWLRNGAACFRGRERLGIVQGRTGPPPGAALTFRSRFYRYESASCVYDGCNIFYLKRAFDEAGGYSPYYYWDVRRDQHDFLTRAIPALTAFRYIMEYTGFDTDLGWRVARNWETSYCESAVVYHDVRELTLFRWLIDEGCYSYAFPRLAKQHPLIRKYLFSRWFFHRNHAFLLLLIASLLGAALVHPIAAVLAIPYFIGRASEPSRVWRGILAPLRALVYLPRDLITMGFLLAGSLRNRTLIV